MESTGVLALFLFAIVSPLAVSGNVCTSPQVSSDYYTTTEASASTETVFIVQFSVTCKNGAKNLNLYADINGKTLPVTQAAEGSKFQYQVSYSDEHKSLPAGQYGVKVYDEEGFVSIRKAQRSGESSASVQSLFTVKVHHPGVWKGPMVQSEIVAAVVAILVYYLAYSAKNKLQS